VDEFVDTSAWRYAVISVEPEPGRERLVIAYPDEETCGTSSRHLVL
jgi:hypothetical protein